MNGSSREYSGIKRAAGWCDAAEGDLNSSGSGAAEDRRSALVRMEYAEGMSFTRQCTAGGEYADTDRPRERTAA
ncbi:hypothetical protein [Paenibacillus stellifer]|uniref:hypothetical protein n=1 Tax=Paenibacillus stellifer TaxID=169760 RepID=UPI0012EDC10B|nr:hypothetical protein [Paenibacillus stellifer]